MAASVAGFVLLLSVVAAVGAVAEPLVRGVPMAEQALYAGDVFACKSDPTVEVPRARVNDDYCDCADGSDEPGTSACANGRFYCHNKGHKGIFLPSSRVDDGICDCCDGSDEPSGKCANTCRALGEQERQQTVEELARVEAGLKVKAQWIAQAAETKKAKQAEREKLAAELADLEAHLDAARAVKETEEAKEKEENDRREAERAANAPSTPEEGDEEEEGEGEKDAEPQHPEDKNDGSSTEKEEEEAAFPYPAEYAAPKEQEEKEQNTENNEGSDSSSSSSSAEEKEEEGEAAFPYPAEYAAPSEPEESPAADEQTDGGEVDDSDETEVDAPDELEHYVSEEAEAARAVFQEAERERNDVKRKLDEIDAYLGLDFGDNDEYAPLHGQCMSLKVKNYEYEMCGYDKATQKERSSTSLGSFSKFDREKLQFEFTGGQHCWNGPSRSLTAILQCGDENKIIDVAEPSKCVYTMRFATPAACSELHRQQLELELEASGLDE